MIRIVENISLYEILNKLFIGIGDFDNPEHTIIRKEGLDDFYIIAVPTSSHIGAIRTITSIHPNFKDVQVKIKSFELDYDFVVVRSEKIAPDSVLLETMTLVEVFNLCNVNEEIKNLWKFEESNFYVETPDAEENSNQ